MGLPGTQTTQAFGQVLGRSVPGAYSFNVQWHYALDIPGDSDDAKYLCSKTLWMLRHVVAEKGLDRELFNATTETLAKVFGVDTSKQRIDSVHIRSNMRRLGVKSMTTFGILLRVLKDQCDVTDQSAEMALKNPKQILSSSLQNPSDPDAGYDAHKGQGYQVQVMETYCDSSDKAIKEKTLNLITHVEIESAHVSDVHALIPALESTKERGLAPEEVLADTLYGSDDNSEKAKKMRVEVVSPVMGTPKEESLSLADFPQTEKGKISSCPQGHAPVKFKQGKKNICNVAFASEHCSICPLLDQCPVKPGKKRHYLRFDLKTLRIATRRAREHTPEFKDKYRWRSGIESTFSEMDKKTGVKRLRVRGLSAVGYCARLKAIGVNLFRATRVKNPQNRPRCSFGRHPFYYLGCQRAFPEPVAPAQLYF